MAERVMLVCDTCGKPAEESVLIKTSSGNRQRDYCAAHLSELLAGSRVPKRGRKPGQAGAKAPATTGARRGRPRKKTTRKKSTARKA